MEEIWLPVKDYETSYWVSNLGRVKSIRKVLKPVRGSGNMLVSLARHGTSETRSIAHLVMCAFVTGWEDKRPPLRYLDGNIENCRLDNLELVTIQDLPGEIWKDIENYEGYYQVSNKGRIRSCTRPVRHDEEGNVISVRRGILLSPTADEDGYFDVGLRKNNEDRYFGVHTLVAKTFIPNPNNLPQVNHRDGDKGNNFVDNLEWVTCQENIEHSIKTGLRDSSKRSSISYQRHPVVCDQTGQQFATVKEAAEFFHVSYSYLVDRIRKGRPYKEYTFTSLKYPTTARKEN